MVSCDCLASSDSAIPSRFAIARKPPRNRAVSKLPGSRLLMVTFLSAMLRATPATNAVSPALAALDKSSPASGIFTLREVIFTILPNPRAAIASMTR